MNDSYPTSHCLPLLFNQTVLSSWSNHFIYILSTIYQGELSDVQEDVQETSEVEDSFTLFAGLPQSTPQKSRTPDFKAPLPWQQTKSPSGLAPTWTQQPVGDEPFLMFLLQVLCNDTRKF